MGKDGSEGGNVGLLHNAGDGVSVFPDDFEYIQRPLVPVGVCCIHSKFLIGQTLLLLCRPELLGLAWRLLFSKTLYLSLGKAPQV